VPDPERNRGEYFADQRFYTAVEHELGPDAMVFQLPWASYPEAPLVNGRLPPAELLRPLLHTETVRWSFGAIRGREADWQAELSRRPVPDLVDRLAAVGYSALTVDRAGFDDGGADLERRLTALLGPPTVSETNRIALFDLRHRRAALAEELGPAGVEALATDTRTVPTFWFTDGFLPAVPAPDGDQRWAKRSSRIEVWNRSGRRRPAEVRLEVRTLSGADDTVTIDAGGELQQVAVPVGGWVAVTVPVELAEGRTSIRLRASGDGLMGDVRDVHLVVRNASGRFTDQLHPAGYN
jgi:phosphoglycerol transferase